MAAIFSRLGFYYILIRYEYFFEPQLRGWTNPAWTGELRGGTRGRRHAKPARKI